MSTYARFCHKKWPGKYQSISVTKLLVLPLIYLMWSTTLEASSFVVVVVVESRKIR